MTFTNGTAWRSLPDACSLEETPSASRSGVPVGSRIRALPKGRPEPSPPERSQRAA